MNLFNELNYNTYYQVVNPYEIGGNTTRKRVFVILIRKDIDIKFNFPKKIKSAKCIKDCLITNIKHTYLDKSEYIPWERPVEKQHGYLKKDYFWLKTNRDEQTRIFNINYPCPTIQRNGRILINDGVGVRFLLKEELKLILGFDNDLDLTHLSNTQYKSQLGNTMEVETMKQLLSEIIRIDKLHLQSKTKSNNTDYQPLKDKIVS
jgi:site-specific DNA-cytosine methylase